MPERQKYKIWKVKDFELVEEMRLKKYSYKDISLHFNITPNALYKAIKRYKEYSLIQGPQKSVKVCSFKEVYTIASELKINHMKNIVDILRYINAIRQNSTLPKIILGQY